MAESGSYTLKQLGDKATYAEILRFLGNLNVQVFASEILPPDDPPAQIFCPTLDYPQAKPKEWPLAIREHRTETERSQYLYIGDIFRLIDEIHAKLIADGEKLSSENLESPAAERVARLVAAENDLFTRTNLSAVKEKISTGQEEYLLEYHKGHYRELSDRLEIYISVATDVARELHEDLEVTQELTAELDVGDDVGEGTTTPENLEAAPTRAFTQEEAGRDQGGSEDQTNQQTRPTHLTQQRPTTQPTTRTDFENIRTLGLESERLTNAFLTNFAEHSQMPPGLFQQELHDIVRFNLQRVMLEQLGVANMQDLYANPVLRLKILSHLYAELGKDPRFIVGLNRAIEQRYRELKQAGNTEALKALKKRLEEAKTRADFAVFAQSFTDNPVFDTPPEFSPTAADSQTELRLVCSSLEYFDQGRLDFDIHRITETVDGMIALGNQPAILDALTTARFNQIFDTHLSPSQFQEFRQILAVYWHLRRQEFLSGGVKIDFRRYGIDPAEQEEIRRSSDAEFTAKHVRPVKTIISAAGKNGGYARDYVLAAGTGVDEHQSYQSTSAAENSYIRKLKADIYNKELWRQLKIQEQLAIYEHYYADQYSAEELQQMLAAGHIPPQFCLGDVGEAHITLGQNRIADNSSAADDIEEYESPYADIDVGTNPLSSIRRSMAGRRDPIAKAIGASSKKARQNFSKRTAANAGKRLTKLTSKKTTQVVNKNLDTAAGKIALQGASLLVDAAGIPALGSILRALPPEVQEFVGKTIKYLTGGLLGMGMLLSALWAHVVLPSLMAGGALIGGTIGFFVGGGPLTALLGAGIGGLVGLGAGLAIEFSHAMVYWAKKLLNSLNHAAAATAPTGATAPSTSAAPTSTASFIKASGAQGGGIISGMSATAAQAVGYTITGITVGAIFSNLVFTSALLADFPSNTTNSNNPNEKLSDYASIEKTIVTGCPDDHCPEITSGNITVTYKIVITPKGDGTCISITEINDILKTRYSEKKYKELGLPTPSKPDRVKHLGDFSPDLSADPNDPRNTVCTGKSITLTYDETFDASYNHSTITNTFEAKFYWKNSTKSGTDSVMTGKSFCIGDCSMTAGCWPVTGSISQPPFGTYSHQRADAFDIAASMGAPIYAPFSGTACVANIDPGLGNHVSLQAAEGSFVFGHMSEIEISGCQQVEAGTIIGLVGSTGNSSGPHLHYEMAMNGGFFRASPPSSNAQLVPPSDKCVKPIDVNNYVGVTVTSCYDQPPPQCANE